MKLPTELRLSAGWLFIKGYAEERLSQLRNRLEGDLSEADTIAVRAAIREMKKLRGLDDPALVFTENDE